ncbi:MAG TPA: hypothetical protein VHA80_01065 [Solirubrobacterales bacterium]|nr:hypothetical protein [Solirubrobacterales bacterium]
MRGLAVEVRPGPAATTCGLGSELMVSGSLVASVAVCRPAPNDVAGSRTEQTRIQAERAAFGQAVREAFAVAGPIAPGASQVIRHRARRDEDNTWATCLAVLFGSSTRRRGVPHWSAGAPLAGRRPGSVACIADPGLDALVVYEIWG